MALGSILAGLSSCGVTSMFRVPAAPGTPLLRDAGPVIINLVFKRGATKKSKSASTNVHSRAPPKHLGMKLANGQIAFPGQILVRQHGFKFHPGYNVHMGRDHTLHAKTVGKVLVKWERAWKDGQLLRRRFIHVWPLGNDWSRGYAKKVEAMVEVRRQVKHAMLKRHVGQ